MVNYHPWNLTGLTTVNGSVANQGVTFLHETSAQVGYLPGTFIIVSLFLVLFLALRAKGTDAKAAFAGSSWAITMVALLIYPLGILHSSLFIGCMILTPISIFFMFILQD